MAAVSFPTIPLGKTMEQRYWINARDKLGLLVALMHELASNNSQIILEGNLTSFDFTKIEQYKMASSYKCDSDTNVISLQLTEGNIKPILKQIQSAGKFVHEIRNIQIRKNDEIQLLVGDNFDNECISVGELVSFEFLSTLKDNGIVRKIQTDAEAKAKYPWLNA